MSGTLNFILQYCVWKHNWILLFIPVICLNMFCFLLSSWRGLRLCLVYLEMLSYIANGCGILLHTDLCFYGNNYMILFYLLMKKFHSKYSNAWLNLYSGLQCDDVAAHIYLPGFKSILRSLFTLVPFIVVSEINL